MYMLQDTQRIEMGQTLAKIAQCLKCVLGVCESVWRSVWKYVWKFYHWDSEIIYMLFNTQYDEIRQKLSKIA